MSRRHVPDGAIKLMDRPSEDYVRFKLKWMVTRLIKGLTLSKLHQLYFSQGGRCVHCEGYMWVFKGAGKRPQSIANAPFVATWEHLTPQSKGGTSDLNNLAAACARCNRIRGDAEFIWPILEASHA
jgi:hypothetical protein